MIELVELEKIQAELAQRNVKVYVISLEDRAAAEQSQSEYPHLTVIADADRKLIEATAMLHPQGGDKGQDVAAPGTVLVDEQGIVRWFYRPARFISRLSASEVLAAIDRTFPNAGSARSGEKR